MPFGHCKPFSKWRAHGIFNRSGTTNQTIELDMGTHTVSLGVPKDFTPKNMKIVLEDTTVFSPMEVRFEKI